jgi:hypothetical protein
MGRGRAKAKQQKVARELKYNTQSTDFTALERELGHASQSDPRTTDDPYVDDDYEDEQSWVSGPR